MERVIFVNWMSNRFYGALVSETERGIKLTEMGDELKGFYCFPMITQMLQEGALLQLFIDQLGWLHLDIGFKKHEGPYAEAEYLEIRESVEDLDTSILSGLSLLEDRLAHPTPKNYVKAYRPYGRVRYQ